MSSSSNEPISVNSSQQEYDNQIAATQDSNLQGSGGMMASAKSQFDSVAGGTSVPAGDVKDNVVGAAGQSLNAIRETVVDGAVPAAKETLQTAQNKLGSLAGGNAAQADHVDAEQIDQLDTERVCDFLRESHMSTKPQPSKK